MPRPVPLTMWRRLTGGMDRSLPAEDPRYPQHRSPDMLNLLVRDGVNVKWPGTVQYTAAALPGAVRFLADFLQADGTHSLVASDGRRFWVYDAENAGWDSISPTYDAGDVSRAQGSAIVTGSGTLWATAGETNAAPLAGDLFHGPDAVDYDIESVDSDTQLTLASVPEGAAWTNGVYNIVYRFGAVGVEWLRAAQASGQILVVNGCDTPFLWTGSGLMVRMVPDGGCDAMPVARFIATFHMQNLCVMANVSGYPRRLVSSDVGAYRQWTTGLAASYDFNVMAGDILGIDGGHEFLFVFFPDGIWRGVWSGTDVQMEWAQVPSIDGPLCPNALLRLGAQTQDLREGALTRWAWLGQGNVYQFNGETVSPIGDPIRAWLFDQLDTDYLDALQGVVIPEWHLAVWSFPIKGSDGACARSLALDYETGEWFPSDRGYQRLGRYVLQQADATEIDQLVGTIDAQTGTIDPPAVVATPMTAVGDADGLVHYLSLRSAVASLGSWSYRRTPIVTPNGGDAVDLAEVTVESEEAAGTRLQVDAWGAERASEQALAAGGYEGHSATLDNAGQAGHSFSLAPRAIQIRVSNNDPGAGFGVTAIVPYVVRRGK